MSSFTKFGLAALLSTTASALVRRQAPSNPTTCFNLEAVAEGQAFNGQFLSILPNPAQNYTTGLQTAQAEGTVFTVDFTNVSTGALFAVNAPGIPAKSVPVLPSDQVSAPVSWFNMADAAGANSLQCQVEVATGYLKCAGVEQFNICSGTLYATTATEVPAGCEAVNLLRLATTCPEVPVSSSSMGYNSSMSSTTMMQSTTGPVSNATMTSTSAGAPTSTLGPLRPTAPGTIGNWNLLGCANSPSGFLGWVQVASTPIMTDEYCTVSCTNYRYAGTNGANCYCAVELQDVSTTTYPDSCDIPCPGNAAQACGGLVPTNGTLPTNGTMTALANAKRQLNLQSLLLTTYVNLAFDAQPPADIVIGDIIINIDIIVYVDVCDACAGGLTTCTTTSTLSATACGCPTDVLPTIPLTTVTRPCESCGPNGGPSTITVTIPVDAVTTRTQTLPGGAVITAAPGAPGAGAPGAGAPGAGAPGVPGGAGVTGAPMPTTGPVFTGEARREVGTLVGAVAAGFLAMLL